jgi:hypothetical protein
VTVSVGRSDVTKEGWFDSYGVLPWKEERLHLDNFGIYLRTNPEMIGYVAVYVGKGQSSKRLTKRLVRAKRYLIAEFQIDGDRIKTVNAGLKERTTVVLQPVKAGLPSPFAQTVRQTGFDNWTSIVPLQSQRKTVEQMFGKPTSESTSLYDPKILVWYSAGICRENLNSVWNDPRDTATGYLVSPPGSFQGHVRTQC